MTIGPQVSKYFVSIREGGKHGPTIWADTVDATNLEAARTHAELEFTKDRGVCPSSDPSAMQFWARVDETRQRVMATGYVVMGRRSKAKAEGGAS